jgi:hypothetical protein
VKERLDTDRLIVGISLGEPSIMQRRRISSRLSNEASPRAQYATDRTRCRVDFGGGGRCQCWKPSKRRSSRTVRFACTNPCDSP